MKIHAKLLVDWTTIAEAGFTIKTPNWVDGGTYSDLIEATAATQIAFPGAWLSVSPEGFVVHDATTNHQVALLEIVHEPVDDE